MGRFFCWIAYFLSAVGAINWGLVIFFNFNLVEYLNKITGGYGLDKIIYGVIALAGIYTIVSLFTFKSH